MFGEGANPPMSTEASAARSSCAGVLRAKTMRASSSMRERSTSSDPKRRGIPISVSSRFTAGTTAAARELAGSPGRVGDGRGEVRAARFDRVREGIDARERRLPRGQGGEKVGVEDRDPRERAGPAQRELRAELVIEKRRARRDLAPRARRRGDGE